MKKISGSGNNFSSEQIKYLNNVRIIQTNLIHAHGFPKNIARTELLKSKEFFGKYGTIIKATTTYKINPYNNKKLYSTYIIYSNEKEAALAVLDSQIINDKKICVIFGTNKYCNYFLNNKKCPNIDKCMFIHQLVTDKYFIIDDESNFTYNDHINLSKKILNLPDIKKLKLINKTNPKKNILSSSEFKFLTKEENELYFKSGNIRNIESDVISDKNNKKGKNNIFFNDLNEQNNFSDKNACRKCKYSNFPMDKNPNNLFDLNIVNNEINEINFISGSNSIEPIELYKLFNNSINHILSVQPFFCKLNNFPLRKMELSFFKNDLAKNNKDINILLEGCLDSLKKI